MSIKYWFSEKQLAIRFRENKVSSKERFIYYFASNIIMLICMYLNTIDRTCEKCKWDNYAYYLIIILSLLGLIKAYNINKSGDDKEFIDRYICIGVPVLIKMYTFIAVFTIVALIILDVFLNYQLPNCSILNGSFTVILFTIYCILRINYLIKFISH